MKITPEKFRERSWHAVAPDDVLSVLSDLVAMEWYKWLRRQPEMSLNLEKSKNR